MRQPARLTSSLLARKGQALPASAQPRAAISTSQPSPPVPLACPGRRRADNVRSLRIPAASTAGRSNRHKVGQNSRVALTVKLERARHARLKILAARQQRTSQDVMIEALDALLEACGPACECMRTGAGCDAPN